MQFVDFKLQKNLFIILLMWYQLYYVLIYKKIYSKFNNNLQWEIYLSSCWNEWHGLICGHDDRT